MSKHIRHDGSVEGLNLLGLLGLPLRVPHGGGTRELMLLVDPAWICRVADTIRACGEGTEPGHVAEHMHRHEPPAPCPHCAMGSARGSTTGGVTLVEMVDLEVVDLRRQRDAAVGEARRARELAMGRTTPPTMAELELHSVWLVSNMVEEFQSVAGQMRRMRDAQTDVDSFLRSTHGVVWIPLARATLPPAIGYRPCAWPAAS